MTCRSIAFVLSVLLGYSAFAQKGDPENFVLDRAEILSGNERHTLNREILELQDSIGSEIIVLTILSLDSVPINTYANRFFNNFNKRGIGRDGFADGILILVALTDRKVRIEVGYGLEKIIPDERAAKILAEDVVPQFKQQNYFKGILNSVKRIKSLIFSNPELVGERR